MFPNQQNEDNFFNAVNVVSLMLAYANLQENRAQSAYNDVHSANDEQAEYLIGEIKKMLDAQNLRLQRHEEMLTIIMEGMKAIYDKLND